MISAHDATHMLPSSPAALLRNVLRILVPASVALTIYIYLYPVFQTCAFPLPASEASSQSSTDPSWEAFVETARLHSPWNSNGGGPEGIGAPFRLLALGDPQLEGDTSIPNAHTASFPHLWNALEHLTFQSEQPSLRERIRWALHDWVDFVFEDIFNTIESIRKRIDLFGNDFYLAHIYRTVHWWTGPTHVAVLGDLLGSQWIDDDEFERRADRFWSRVARGGERVPDDIAVLPSDDYKVAGYLGTPADNETRAWTRRIINIAGNHDIGYAGDINNERLDRFERFFGRANYELRFELPIETLSPGAAATIHNESTNPESTRLAPELRIVNLNDMNLDTPALSPEIQDATYDFINAIINTAAAVEFDGHFTIVLTHIPLHKPEGICVDAPFFAFHDHDGTLQEQNQLSADASRGFLEGIFGMHGDPNAAANGRGRRGLILNGHDHEGCDSYHFINQLQGASPADRSWESMRWAPARDGGIVGKSGHPGIREITVRSMMGDFGGNAGLLSVWFDEDSWEWKSDFATCSLGRQHMWWVVHILDLATLLGGIAYLVLVASKACGWNVDRWPARLRTAAEGKATAKKLGSAPPATEIPANGSVKKSPAAAS